MKKMVILADILLLVLFGLFLCVETMDTYVIFGGFFVLSLLITEIFIILYVPRVLKFFKWFISISTVSILIAQLPNALLLVALSQYGCLLLLITLFVVSLFRIVCIFRV